MPAQLSGRIFILGFAVVIAIVAVVGFLSLRRASDRRFAISIHSIPESPHADLLALNRPILVRIDKRSAGRSSQAAFAMLFDGSGRPLKELQALTVRQLEGGKRTEDVVFPALTTLPSQRLLADIVLRLPAEQVAAARSGIAVVLQSLPPGHRSLPDVFGHILTFSRDLGGHA
jgi:hypothetical protein